MSIPRVIVLGSLNMDLTSYVPRYPEPGETLASTSYFVSPGGKGANQAVACAKVSRSCDHGRTLSDGALEVSMVGVVGNDEYGDRLLSNLTMHGVDTSLVARNSYLSTGTATIIVDEANGQNRIVFSPGANHATGMIRERISSLFVGHAKRPDLLVMQLETPISIVLEALSAAKVAGVPVLLNPAPAQRLPDEAYIGLSHIILNETEAAILTGYKERDLETKEGLSSIGGWFLERQVQNIIITLGGRGVYYCTRDGLEGLLPAEKANVVDTTAAGDTFVGSYSASLVTFDQGHFDIRAAVKIANRAAAKTVESRGAQNSIPWKNELNI